MKTIINYTLESLFSYLNSTEQGLSTKEAQHRLAENGPNILSNKKPQTSFQRLIEATINPFNVILLVVALVTAMTDIFLTSKPDYLTVSIIVSLVILSSAVAFYQSERAYQESSKLTQLISSDAHVYRDNTLMAIDFEEIVLGDVIHLSAGDMIPADVRFIFTKDTFVSQSALTGESQPVEKFSDIRNPLSESLTDNNFLGFMGTNIVSGSAKAIVIATGDNTYFGSMAQSLASEDKKTSFERGVNAVSKLMIRVMLIMIPIVFVINGIAKNDWFSALLFSLSIAVGLTPEMLPVIMTSTLAKGAMAMSKHKVIVRNLGSIQTFGEMDILCTDKTGTLTQDEIVLERYMNVHGEDDKRVLRHAYLNSYFQTGLKNLIDVAIINRAQKYNLQNILTTYSRIDEIPFDFSRRKMSVVLSDNQGKRQLITKGAVEEMLESSSFIELDGQVLPLDEQTKALALKTYEEQSAQGLRMLGVAQKNEVPDIHTFSEKDESDMVLIGFVAFLDPPKDSAESAISALKEHGVRTVVLTGDAEGVAINVCKKVGIDTTTVIIGSDVEKMSDQELNEAINTSDLFAKLSPLQKQRVVKAFQNAGHTVGYMGDGINDAPPLKQADVGISVDSAVDIAKESADIILLEKDLMVLEEGVLEGRKTFGNMMKYIKMAVSGNFGNMFSVIIASLFLPFLPMLPVQLLTQNLLNDFSQLGIPLDHVDEQYLKVPQKWQPRSIERFMFIMGPLSSIFDILCFGILWWVMGFDKAPYFWAGWFVFGTISQVLIIYMIRTAKKPFIESLPSLPLLISTSLVVIVTITIGFSQLAIGLDMATLPWHFMIWLLILCGLYAVSVQLIKTVYISKYNEWI